MSSIYSPRWTRPSASRARSYSSSVKQNQSWKTTLQHQQHPHPSQSHSSSPSRNCHKANPQNYPSWKPSPSRGQSQACTEPKAPRCCATTTRTTNWSTQSKPSRQDQLGKTWNSSSFRNYSDQHFHRTLTINYQALEGSWSFRVNQGRVQSRGTLPISQKVGIVMRARPKRIQSKGILLPEGIRANWKIRQNRECSCLFTEKASALPPKCLPQTRNIQPSRTKRKKPHSKAVTMPSQQFLTQRVVSNRQHPRTVRTKLSLPVKSVSFLSAILPKRVLPNVDPIPSEIIRYPANLLISSFEVPSQTKIRCGISEEQNPRATPSITRTNSSILILGKKCRTCFNILQGLQSGVGISATASYTKLPSQEVYTSDWLCYGTVLSSALGD